MEKILLFDFDGVIADSFQTIFEAYCSLHQKYKLPELSEKKFSDLFKRNLVESFSKLGMSKLKMLSLFKEFTHLVMKSNRGIPIFKGMGKAISDLSLDNELFIITSNLTKPIEAWLDSHGITSFSEVIGVDKEISKVKKINSVKKRFPELEVIFVTDTVGDIIESKSLGVKVIAVSWGYHRKEDLLKQKPDFLVDSPKELVSLINSL